MGTQEPGGECVARYFVQPTFSPLLGLANEARVVYQGLLTLGDSLIVVQTLRGRVWRLGTTVRVIAEYDIDELMRLNEKMLEINADYAAAQLELAQTDLNLQQREAQIVALTLIDPLTGLGNRRQFDQALAIEISRSRSTGETLCAFMADLDHFKCVNDDFGHEAGDQLLVAFAEMFATADACDRNLGTHGRRRICSSDAAHRSRSRHGNRRANPSDNDRHSDRIPIARGDGKFWCAVLAVGEEGGAFKRRVDKTLYEAKHSGRNCVVAAASAEAICFEPNDVACFDHQRPDANSDECTTMFAGRYFSSCDRS